MVTDDEPELLDNHRGRDAQEATFMRREKSQQSQNKHFVFKRRQIELEKLLLAEPAETWLALAGKAEYLIRLFADTEEAQEPQRQELIAKVLFELDMLTRREGRPS